MTTLSHFIPNVTRVLCPGGIQGTVTNVLTEFRRTGREPRYPILVARDDGSVRAYAASELTVLEQPRGHTLRPLP